MDRKQNAWIILFRAFRNFFSIAFENLFALLSRNPPRAHSYNTLNQTLKDGPKSFYENPTGIKL